MRCEMGNWVMTLHLLLFLFLLQLILLCVCGNAGKVPAIIVFGDSTVDAGNNNQIRTVLKSNFRPYGRDFYGGKPTGRFCNGRLATDFISQAFGLKPTVPAYLDPAYSIKDFTTGVCFASAGTGYDNATSDVLSVIPFSKELDYFKDYQSKLKSYLGMEKAMEIVNEALYILSIGTNDFLENYYTNPHRSSQFTIEEYENFLINIAEEFLTNIYQLGARKISLTGLSPMGCLPLERVTNAMTGSICVESYNTVAKNFNVKLQMMADKLNARLPRFRLVYTHIYDTFLGVIHNPVPYGFDNVGVGCCATGMFEMGYLCDQWNPFTCKDASKYVFWDAFHPTERMNLILAYHSLNTSLAQFL